jgi:hypothetical protein
MRVQQLMMCGVIGSQVAIAWAQPPINQPPKAANPPNTNRPMRDRVVQNRMTVQERREQVVRTLLTRAGFADVEIQNAVVEHLSTRDEARRKTQEASRKLLQAFNPQRRGANQALTDAQLDALLAEYRAAQEVEQSAIERADKALDAKINYSKNVRLEIALMLLGAIGDGNALAGNRQMVVGPILRQERDVRPNRDIPRGAGGAFQPFGGGNAF